MLNTFASLTDLRLKLLDLSNDVFLVKIVSEATGNIFEYNPADAEEWLNRYADSIITSNEDAVLLNVDGSNFKLSIWRLVPQRVNLTVFQ